MIVYKALNKGESPYQHFKWPLPKGKRKGAWVETAFEPVICQRGFHGFLKREDAERVGSEIYEMELTGRIVKDHEKAASSRARLVRLLSEFGPEGPIKRGERNCETCGRPHDSYITTKGMAPSWADLKDGHSYVPETWERYAARLTGYAQRHDAYRAARAEAAQAHTGTGTYLPIVPAFHGPFKPWPEHPDRCGTCGLTSDLHSGWQGREQVSEEFKHYDRWDLLLVIQELRAAA